MREETIKCDECKGVVDGEVLCLPEMVVRTINRNEKKVKDLVLAGRGGEKAPDFCGIPCMFKWITNKLNKGVSNGNQS